MKAAYVNKSCYVFSKQNAQNRCVCCPCHISAALGPATCPTTLYVVQYFETPFFVNNNEDLRSFITVRSLNNNVRLNEPLQCVLVFCVFPWHVHVSSCGTALHVKTDISFFMQVNTINYQLIAHGQMYNCADVCTMFDQAMLSDAIRNVHT